jgi:hypothetical protein
MVLDRALRGAVSAENPFRSLAVIEKGTRRGDALPRRPRLHCTMAASRLSDASMQGEGLELELDLLEAERCLWAARAEWLAGLIE